MGIILLCRIEDFENLAVPFRQKGLDILTGLPNNFRFLGEIVLPQPLRVCGRLCRTARPLPMICNCLESQRQAGTIELMRERDSRGMRIQNNAIFFAFCGFYRMPNLCRWRSSRETTSRASFGRGFVQHWRLSLK